MQINQVERMVEGILIINSCFKVGSDFWAIKKGKSDSPYNTIKYIFYSAMDLMKLITIHRSSSPLIFFSKFGISSLPINDL